MDWLQFTILMFSVIGLFIANITVILWFRSESRDDWRHMDAKMDAFNGAFLKETKDFHGKLCRLEEKYHKLGG